MGAGNETVHRFRYALGLYYSIVCRILSRQQNRKKRRQSSVKPLVEAYFAWVKEKKADGRVSEKSKTGRGLSYSINQEKYLKVFLEDGNVPMDNNAAERAIKNFCIGRKNWLIIDTIRGAQSSAIIYSIAETAKANNLKPYEYFEYLLEEISSFCTEYSLFFRLKSPCF